MLQVIRVLVLFRTQMYLRPQAWMFAEGDVVVEGLAEILLGGILVGEVEKRTEVEELPLLRNGSELHKGKGYG